MRRAWFWLLGLAMIQLTETSKAAENPIGNTRQMVVVIAENMSARFGLLRAYERTSRAGAWRQRGTDVPVVLGKKGLAWGRGLAAFGGETGPRKVEGDNRAPAGTFRLGPAFGYAPIQSAGWIKLRYLASTDTMEGIDDPRSRFYNRLVDRTKIARPDWRSSERMRRADDLYKWGIFVDHNPEAAPGGGSCIFLHIWKDPSTPTSGCTAMAEPELISLLQWLDPRAKPVLIQMPRENYSALSARFGLPNPR